MKKLLSGIIFTYLGIGAILGIVLEFSYLTMGMVLYFNGCDFFGSSIAGLFGGLIAIPSAILRMFIWPYGLYITYVNDLSYGQWLMPGWYAACGT